MKVERKLSVEMKQMIITNSREMDGVAVENVRKEKKSSFLFGF